MMMIKTVGGNCPTCITEVKDGKIIMNITADSGSSGYIDTDKCNVKTRYDEQLFRMMVRVEV